jgi:VWFA-related protein
MKIRPAIAAAFLLSVGIAAQQQTPSNPPSVTFQTEVNYVDVDAIVTDEQGNFVGNLSKDDFEVREDGKAQKIDMFSTVDIPLQRQDRFALLNRPISSDVRSNREAFAGRVYVIVLDDLDISPNRTGQTKKQAHEFVEKYLGANDVAAVIYTSGRTDASQEFTADPQLLLAAIDKFVGRRMRPATLDKIDSYYQHLAVATGADPANPDDPQAQEAAGIDSFTPSNIDTGPTVSQKATDLTDPTDFERGYRAMGVLRTLKNLSDYMLTVRGRRKAVIMFSEGIDYPMTDIFGSQSASDVLHAVQDAIAAAARGNVNYFTIDPRGLVGMTTEFIEMTGAGFANISGASANGSVSGGFTAPFAVPDQLLEEMRLSQDSLRVLADETGGFAAINNNSFAGAFDRIVKANSRYYVLGYYPPTHPRDGRFHKIEVRVKRPGLKVTARKGYASPRGKTPEERKRDEEERLARDSKKGGANNTSTALREALNSPMQQGGLTFSVHAAPFKNTDKEAWVALAIELDGGSLQLTQQNNGLVTDDVELSFFSMNDQGKPQTGVRSELNMTLRPETAQRVKAGGVRANPRISLAPGRYQLRIGAREAATSRLGSVFYDVQVPDFTKDPLMLSGMMLAAPSSEQTPTAQPDPVAMKVLLGSPTSRREFVRTDTLSMLSEIYDNSSSRQPRQIDVAVRLLAETGQEVFVARDSLTNTADAKKWDVYAYKKDIPLRDVPAGRYLLQMEAQVRGNQKDKPATRETLITVK